MGIGEDACVRMVCQVLAEPFFFWRSRGATAQALYCAICVQPNDVPRAEVVAVVSLVFRPCLLTPILKICRSGGLSILVISRHGPRAGLKFSPGGVVTILKFGGGTSFVREIPSGKDCSRYAFEQLRRGASSFDVLATCDIACTHKGKCLSVW